MKPRKATAIDHIKDLNPQQLGARRHNSRNIGVIADSMQENGTGRSIVIDEENNILAGNGAVEAAGEVGITKLRVIDTAGDEIIAIRRTGLTKRQKQRLALSDNRAQDLSEQDDDVLRALAEIDGGDVLAGMWTVEEVDELLAEQEAARIETTKIDRPTDIAWVLVGIPMAEWPKHQKAVESLQGAAVFTTMVLRPKDAPETKAEVRRGRK